MAQITNLDLKKQLDELAKTFSDRLEKVEKRVDVLERRMIPTIERVDSFFAFLKKFLTFIKWLGAIIVATVAGQAVIWFFQHVIR